MSNERPSDRTRIRKITGSFKEKLSSLLYLSRAPTPSSFDMDSSSENRTDILLLNMDSVVGDNHAPTTVIATSHGSPMKASTVSPPISASVSSSIHAVPRQLGSTSGLETSHTLMSAVSHPLAPDSTMSAATELEQDSSTQDSSLGLFANAQNILTTVSPPISAPVSSSIVLAVPRQHDSIQPETPSTHMSAVSCSPLSPYSPDSIMHNSNSGFFGNAQNMLINGGSFINVHSVNTDKGQMKTPVSRKPNSSPLFIGRKDVLDKLGKIFVHGADGKLMSRHSCLLWGTGGIGKTQICLKFIEGLSDWLSHVFWVDASSLESINVSFKGISGIPAAQASCLDGSAESILKWISGIQEEWLIVFDNADNLPPDVVAKFIPPGNRGNILITSRNRSMGRLIAFENVIEIIEMEEADAITLLLKASCLDASADHLQAAKNIVASLGCMPLAVDQAGAYIEARKCDINEYLRQFSSHRQILMLDVTFRGASDYDRTVYGAWDLSFKEIEKRAGGQSSGGNAQAANAAILILGICAFYHHSNISEDIFRSAAEESGKYVIDSGLAINFPLAVNSLDCTLLALDNDGHWDEFIYRQGVGVLLSFSLIKRDQSSKMLSVHPLIHCWSREQMSKNKQQRMYEIGTIILSCAISHRLTSYDYRLRQLIFSHIKATELHSSEMGLAKQYYDDKCNNFRFVMEENGDWSNAEQLAMQVVNMRKKLLGAQHPDTLISIGNLARTYRHQKGLRKLSDAEQLEEQVLNMSRKLLGAEHQDTITCMEYLAKTYLRQRKLNEAEQLMVQVLDMRKKLLGTGHPDTITSMGNLARTYCHQGNLNEAEQLEVQVLDMRKKLLGAEHPDVITSMRNLAKTYYIQGKLNEAEQLEIQVLDVSKKLLGAEHPDTITSMGNLARTYRRQGNLNEAEQLKVHVVNLRKKLLGAEHPHTIKGMESLARTYHYRGKLNEAEQLKVQVLNIKKLLDTEHSDNLEHGKSSKIKN